MNLSQPTRIQLQYDAPKANVQKILRKELQTTHILSSVISNNYVTIELAPSIRCKSAILWSGKVADISATVVDDHSALLPVWLEQFHKERGLLHVHIDRHSDLGMPNLLRVGDKLVDRFSDCGVTPSDLESVILAVNSTAIEIGNFLTLALKWLSIKTLVWLHPPEIEPVTRGIGLRIGWTGVDPLFSSDLRLEASPILDGNFDVALHVSSKLKELESIIATNDNLDIILDIDLDYFDNSHEALDQQKPMPIGAAPEVEWLRQQEAVLDDLFSVIPAGRLRSVGIARSPGFCPPQVADALVKLVLDRLSWFYRRKEG
jgi:hypothetical protein